MGFSVHFQEIDAQLRLLKPKRPVRLSAGAANFGSRSGSPLRRRPQTPKVGTLQELSETAVNWLANRHFQNRT